MYQLFAFIFLLLIQNASAQVDQQKLDSLKQSIDAHSKKVQAWQDSFKKKQDSIYQSYIDEEKGTIVTPADEKDHARKKKEILIPVVITVMFLLLLFLLVRKRKTDS